MGTGEGIQVDPNQRRERVKAPMCLRRREVRDESGGSSYEYGGRGERGQWRERKRGLDKRVADKVSKWYRKITYVTVRSMM